MATVDIKGLTSWQSALWHSSWFIGVGAALLAEDFLRVNMLGRIQTNWLNISGLNSVHFDSHLLEFW